jgi:YVTN family beta-propeller protein
VGREPSCVAITPDDRKVDVTNMASGTVSGINAYAWKVVDIIKVGAEPFGCALTPDGRQLYVANQSSNTVSVINTRRDRVSKTIHRVGVKPRGIAITADGKQVYVTQFLSQPRAGDPRPLTQTEGADDGREGRVTVIDAYSNQVTGTVTLNPIANTGFLSDGNTLGREPVTTVFDNVTGGVRASSRASSSGTPSPTCRAPALRRTVPSGSTSTSRAACRRLTRPRILKRLRRST